MGLEDIVNFLLKPIESIVKKVASYAPKSMQEHLQVIGKDYLTVKEFLMKYTLRPVDHVSRVAYDVVEAPVKALYEALDTKVFTPSLEYVKKNPRKVLGLGLALPLGYLIYNLPIAYVGYRLTRFAYTFT